MEDEIYPFDHYFTLYFRLKSALQIRYSSKKCTDKTHFEVIQISVQIFEAQYPILRNI